MLAVYIDGKRHLIMSEVKERLFPDISRTALRSLMSRRHIKTVLATAHIRSCLQQKLGNTRGGTYLIGIDDATHLLAARGKANASKAACGGGGGGGGDRPSNVPIPSSSCAAVDQEEAQDLYGAVDFLTICEQVLSEPSPAQQSPDNQGATDADRIVDSGHVSDEARDTAAMPPVKSLVKPLVGQQSAAASLVNPLSCPNTATGEPSKSVSTGIAAGKSRRTWSASPRLDAGIERQLQDMSKFYTRTINPLRASVCLGENSMLRHLQRIRRYLHFVATVHEDKKHGLQDALDIDLCSKYIEEMSDRHMSNGTMANHIQTLIVLAKYILRDTRHRDSWEDVPEIASLRHMQSQLMVSCNSMKTSI